MKINSTSERGVTVQGQFKVWSDTEDREITVNSKTISWDTLRAAAKQEDAELAGVYADLLARSEKMETSRLISENWKQYGYPLRTGFGHQYAGQIVIRAWEVRRKQYDRKDVRIAYIIAWDRSVPEVRVESTSPEFADIAACYEWLTKNYGGWHDELGGERTASTWLHD